LPFKCDLHGYKTVHTNIPNHTKSILMYGAPRTGKTGLAHAVANAAGANFFNLSPRNIDGKYPGSQVKMLIHMVGSCTVVASS
jgi:ATP-dependent 26S proteasome regulatory subunit